MKCNWTIWTEDLDINLNPGECTEVHVNCVWLNFGNFLSRTAQHLSVTFLPLPYICILIEKEAKLKRTSWVRLPDRDRGRGVSFTTSIGRSICYVSISRHAEWLCLPTPFKSFWISASLTTTFQAYHANYITLGHPMYTGLDTIGSRRIPPLFQYYTRPAVPHFQQPACWNHMRLTGERSLWYPYAHRLRPWCIFVFASA